MKIRKLKIVSKIILCTVLINGFFIVSNAMCQTDLEYSLKAAFIEKLIKYIKWPEESIKNDNFVIGVIGKNPFGKSLNDTFKDVEYNGKKVLIKYFADVSDYTFCNILFITKSMSGRLEDVIDLTIGKPVLSVSDSKGFAEQGSIINLFLNDKKKLRFEYNQRSSRRSGLVIDPLLIKIAKIISPR